MKYRHLVMAAWFFLVAGDDLWTVRYPGTKHGHKVCVQELHWLQGQKSYSYQFIGCYKGPVGTDSIPGSGPGIPINPGTVDGVPVGVVVVGVPAIP